MGQQETTDGLDGALDTTAQRFAEGLCADMVDGLPRWQARVSVSARWLNAASIGTALRAFAAIVAGFFRWPSGRDAEIRALAGLSRVSVLLEQSELRLEPALRDQGRHHGA
jgi:transposase